MCDECCNKTKDCCGKDCRGQIIIGGCDDRKDKHKHHKRKHKHQKCPKCRKHHCKCEPIIIFIDHYPCCVCCCCPRKCDPCHSHHPPRQCYHEKPWFEWDEWN